MAFQGLEFGFSRRFKAKLSPCVGDLDYGKLSSLRSLHRIHWKEMIQAEWDSTEGRGIMHRGGFGKDRELDAAVYLLHKYLKYSYFWNYDFVGENEV